MHQSTEAYKRFAIYNSLFSFDVFYAGDSLNIFETDFWSLLSLLVKERRLSHLLEFVENQELTTVDETSGIPLASPFFIPQPFIKGL